MFVPDRRFKLTCLIESLRHMFLGISWQRNLPSAFGVRGVEVIGERRTPFVSCSKEKGGWIKGGDGSRFDNVCEVLARLDRGLDLGSGCADNSAVSIQGYRVKVL